jgi:cyclopropane-fatty-acyl-phospholipid synthase
MARLLRRVRGGTIVLVEAGRERRFGGGSPEVRLVVQDSRAFASVLRHGNLGLGASYINGWWNCDDLTELLQILWRTVATSSHRHDRWARRFAPLRLGARWSESANLVRDRNNIRAHYDLSNQFFELMLDETMAYSCGFFTDSSVDLASASRAKFDRLCRKIALGAGDHLLEIGTGWGGFAMHAAREYGARVTTTTISDAQYDYARRRVHEAGLDDRVTVLNCDYRELTGVYDKIVSIEMIEAIGWRQLDTYFATCARLLAPTGLMGLQAIVIEDRSYERAKTKDDFIKHFVFPGGFLPSIEAMSSSMASVTDLSIVDLEDIGRHYAETLRRWRANLEHQREALDELELSEDFNRLWHYYLCYCEAGFLDRHVTGVQLVLARDRWRGALAPLATRD